MKNDSTYSTWVKAAGSWGYSRPAAKRRAHPVRGHRRGDAPIPHTRGRRAGVGPPARAPRLPCGSPLGHLEKQKALLDVEFPISFPCQVVTKEAHGLGPVHSLPALSPLLRRDATAAASVFSSVSGDATGTPLPRFLSPTLLSSARGLLTLHPSSVTPG
jgi:hypothetical protein